MSKAHQTVACPACPACGSHMKIERFAVAHNLDGSINEINEDLYCDKCDIRWISEAHPDRLK